MVRTGEITEIVGDPSSGRTSLLVRTMCEATQRGGLVALVDTDQAFDPASASRAGVDLRRLLWIRCSGRRDVALRATDLLVRCPGFTLVGLDVGERPPRLPLTLAFRLRLTVRRTGSALVILASRRIAGAGASLAVRTVQRGLEWSGPGSASTRLARLGSRVEVLRQRGGLDGEALSDATWWWTA